MDRWTVQVVAAGEAGGVLVPALEALAEVLEWEVALGARGVARGGGSAAGAAASQASRAPDGGAAPADPAAAALELGRLARVLRALLCPGMPILDALEETAASLRDAELAGSLRSLRDEVLQGEEFEAAALRCFPAPVADVLREAFGAAGPDPSEALRHVAAHADRVLGDRGAL